VALRYTLHSLVFLWGFVVACSASAAEFDPRPGLLAQQDEWLGRSIDASSLAQFDAYLPPALSEVIAKGATELTTGPFITVPVHPRYVEATDQFGGQAELGDEVGDLLNYQQGRPFPGLPEASDPRAGEKIAWNMRYGYGPDEAETELMTWRYKNMRTNNEERRIEMYGAIMRFDHRHVREPLPAIEQNRAELYSALYLKVDFPFDIKNTQLLTHTKLDDGEPEQAWIYLNTQRRVKRLGTGQKTDAFLGSDIMIEDFLGYNGRIRDMAWEYVGSTEIFAPVYGFDDLSLESKIDLDGHEVIEFGGAGGCFPEITWQPRVVHKVKATPLAESHPIGHRLFYIDAATYAPMVTEIFDRAGKLWKLGVVAVSDSSKHGEENAEWQGLITDGVTMIDLQAEHCTTLQFDTRIPDQLLRTQLFTTQQMRSAGR
tara:strand:+ start:4770 stop:6056 length:1287 start_codon:yes stop_codon:yes gene_type:complete